MADTKCPNAGFIGGLGSGKTVVGTALTLYLLEKYPGIRILVCAPTYDQLAQGTLMSFMEWCPQNYIAGWNRTEHIITFQWQDAQGNPSQILYRSTTEIDRIRAHEYGAVWFDEAAMAPQETIPVIRGRLRSKRGGMGTDWHYPIYMTTTPRGHNWMYRLFTEDKRHDESVAEFASRQKRFKYTHATTYDNADNLPPDYIDLVASSMAGDERLKQQELEGLFVAFDGLVYPQFSEAKHVKPISAPNPVEWDSPAIIRRVAGVDFGGGDPTAVGIYGMGATGKIHKFAEKTWREPVSLTEIGAYLATWHAKAPFEGIACDPSNQTAIATLRSAGLPAGPQVGVKGSHAVTTRAINDRAEGIRLVGDLLSRWMLTFNPECADTITEFYSYLYAKRSDDSGSYLTNTPIDHHGDHMDELRYAMMWLFVFKARGGNVGFAGKHRLTRRAGNSANARVAA